MSNLTHTIGDLFPELASLVGPTPNQQVAAFVALDAEFVPVDDNVAWTPRHNHSHPLNADGTCDCGV